jgi:hypothetical protein
MSDVDYSFPRALLLLVHTHNQIEDYRETNERGQFRIGAQMNQRELQREALGDSHRHVLIDCGRVRESDGKP